MKNIRSVLHGNVSVFKTFNKPMGEEKNTRVTDLITVKKTEFFVVI